MPTTLTKESPITPQLLSLRSAALMTGLSEWTWRAWVSAGKVTSYKLGTRVMIGLDEVERIIREGKRPAVSAGNR